MRAAVRSIDPDLPVARLATMDFVVRDRMFQPRVFGAMFAVFAGAALLLATIGLYGVMSYLVAQRTKELGVRIALGATTRDVMQLVLRGALRLIGIGFAIGIPSAMLLSQLNAKTSPELGRGIMEAIGKSETALELVQRGHRLVADDAVRIVCRDGSRLYGFVSQTIEHHLEIRGLGIINISDLFGSGAVRANKRIDLIVHLEDWDDKKEYDRLGLEDLTEEILGVEIAVMTIPVRPGRNVPVLLETAAKNFNLKSRGHNAARKFQERLARMIREAAEN